LTNVSWQLQGNLWFNPSSRWAIGAAYWYYDVTTTGARLDRKIYKMKTQGPTLAVVYGW
jgi:hypothetical protein